jgi:hypothetical protein
MNWVLEGSSKPERWKLVTLQCESQLGYVLEIEAFWTGFTWRIIGNKHGLDSHEIRRWAYKD